MTNDYRVSTDREEMDLDFISDYLKNAYWSPNRSREVIAKSIQNSDCFGIFFRDRQVAFARVVSDRATFGDICDVFVIDAHQGKGLSKWLMREIMGDPAYDTLKRWTLRTRDAHGLYSQFGFRPTSSPEREMEYRPGW